MLKLSSVAVQQAPLQSRQRIAQQTLDSPFLSSSSRDPRLISRVNRVVNVIFDSLSPRATDEQRERFLSLLGPLLIAGAAFVVHSNVDFQWRSATLWSAICALLVQVLWIKSSTPMYPGFGCENAVLLVDLSGEDITVPFQFCQSYEVSRQTSPYLTC